MRNNKWISSIPALVLCFVLIVVAGCSNDNVKPQIPEAIDKKIELVWSGWSGEEEASKASIQGMIDSWNENNPDATVKWLGWPYNNALEQLMVRSVGKEHLDVSQVEYSWLQQLESAGVVEDLNTLFDPQWLDDNFEQSTLDVGKINGKQVGLPWTLASIGMVYNPSLLAKAGIFEPPTTIAQFEEVLQKLKDSDPNIIPYALDTNSLNADFSSWLWTFGGSIIDENKNIAIHNEQAVQAVTWLKSLKDRGFIKMNIGRMDARLLFANHLVGFYDDAILAKGFLVGNGVAIDELDNQIKPMLRPVLHEGDVPQSALWGHTLVIFNHSEHKQEAAEFLKHLVSDSQSIPYFEQMGLMPVTKSGLANDKVIHDEWAKDWSAITKTGRIKETRDYKQTAELNDIIKNAVQAALLGEKSPQQAMEEAAEKIRIALK